MDAFAGTRARPIWISVAYSVVTVVPTVVLIRAYGPQAAGAGILIASVVRVAATLVVTRRGFFPQLHWGQLLVSSVLPLAIGSSSPSVYTNWVTQRRIAGRASQLSMLGWLHLYSPRRSLRR